MDDIEEMELWVGEWVIQMEKIWEDIVHILDYDRMHPLPPGEAGTGLLHQDQLQE